MTVEIKNDRLYAHASYPPQDKDRIWDVVKDGKFIIGANSEDKARQNLADLEASNWQYLELYGRGFKDPLSWIAHVREMHWTFENAAIHLSYDGRVMFHGNICEYSAAFRFLILDLNYAGQVIEQVPDVAVTGYDSTALARFEADVLFLAAGYNSLDDVTDDTVKSRAADFHGLSQRDWGTLSLANKIARVKEAVAAVPA